MFTFSKKTIALALTAICILLAIATAMFSNPSTVSRVDKLTQLTSELKIMVANANSGITNTVTAAQDSKQLAENNLMIAQAQMQLYAKCVEENTRAMEYNNSITLGQFMSG
jgi:hypothetical protein